MTSPVVEQVVENSTATAGTSHTINLPTATAGQLLLIILDKGSTAATVNAHTELTELLDENLANGLYIAYRQMNGSEPASYTLTTSASTRSASFAYRISGAANPAQQAPTIGTTGSGTSTTPDPPASAAAAATRDFLVIAFYGAALEEADDDTWSDTPPTNYTPSPPRQKACGIAGSNLGGLIAAAERALNIASAGTENPGTFAKDVSAAWRSQTVLIYPGATIGPAGAIASGEAFATTNKLNQSVQSVGGIASAEAFGTAKLNFTILNAGNIGSAEAFGAHTLTQGEGSLVIGPAGNIASEEAFGSAALDLTILSVGNIASGEAFGTLALDLTLLNVGAIGSAEAFGAHLVSTAGGAQTVGPAGAIASGEAFGTAAIDLTVKDVGAIASGEAFGAASFDFTISGAGNIGSAEAFGAHTLLGGLVIVITPGHVGASDARANSVGVGDARANSVGSSDARGGTVGAGDQ